MLLRFSKFVYFRRHNEKIARNSFDPNCDRIQWNELYWVHHAQCYSDLLVLGLGKANCLFTFDNFNGLRSGSSLFAGSMHSAPKED